MRTDLQGRGMGGALMDRLLAYAIAEGIERIEGHVLDENTAMLDSACLAASGRRT